MSVDPTRFPLLRLPENVVSKVLQTLTRIELVLVSLLSAKTKHLAALSTTVQKRPTLKVQQIGKCIDIILSEDDGDLRLYYMFSIIMLYNNNRRESMTNFGFSLKQWAEHLKFVFHVKELRGRDIVFVEPILISRVNSVNFLKKTFGAFSSFEVIGNYDDKYHKAIMNTFLPKEAFAMTAPNELLLQNFDALETFSLNLDRLLSISSKTIQKEGFPLTTVVLNRFIKLWIQKKTNPRLERLEMFSEMGVSLETDVLKGVPFMKYPEENLRIFKNSYSGEEHYVRGGCDIVRKDGVSATVLMEWGMFRMYVWQ